MKKQKQKTFAEKETYRHLGIVDAEFHQTSGNERKN